MFYHLYFRLTITASCPMRLHYFPMDRQLCTIEIESCTLFIHLPLSFNIILTCFNTELVMISVKRDIFSFQINIYICSWFRYDWNCVLLVGWNCRRGCLAGCPAASISPCRLSTALSNYSVDHRLATYRHS